MNGKILVSIAFLALTAVSAVGSETVSCSEHCSGTTLYTGGYKVCAGQDCICEFTEVLNSPECPAPPPKERSGDHQD